MSDTNAVDEMTAEEQAVMNAEANRIAGEAEAAKAAETASAGQAAKAAADTAAAEQAKQAAAAAVVPVQQAAPAPVFPTITVDPALAARDFAAEHAELHKAWEEGDMSQSEWAEKLSEIAAAKATLGTQQSMANAIAVAIQKAADQAFEQASRAFLARPENLDLATDPYRLGMFEAVMNTVDKATGNALSAHELLARAQVEFRKQVAAQAPPAPPASAPLRQADLSALPPRLTDIPQTGANADGEGAEIGQLAALGIEDLEARFAGMSDAQIERYLASTPGSGSEIKPAS